MSKYKTIYPKLKYFFSAYFHSDWKSLYDWAGAKPSFQVVVRDFKANNPSTSVVQATQELEKLLAHNLQESELQKIVVHDLGANINASGLGLTYEQWLKIVLEVLKESTK